MVLSTTRYLVVAAKFLVAATKKIFDVPNFVAVTKPFFSENNYKAKEEDEQDIIKQNSSIVPLPKMKIDGPSSPNPRGGAPADYDNYTFS